MFHTGTELPTEREEDRTDHYADKDIVNLGQLVSFLLHCVTKDGLTTGEKNENDPFVQDRLVPGTEVPLDLSPFHGGYLSRSMKKNGATSNEHLLRQSL
ncbi:hypothetical protein BaRGS_00023465 [Batillaria attramentaria]|uniref:Uncharacterized protein n=1 Tax=Batillaria attramentaria TaxID=370345 RepID=A0ABD0KDM4_9CAEN